MNYDGAKVASTQETSYKHVCSKTKSRRACVHFERVLLFQSLEQKLIDQSQNIYHVDKRTYLIAYSKGDGAFLVETFHVLSKFLFSLVG